MPLAVWELATLPELVGMEGSGDGDELCDLELVAVVEQDWDLVTLAEPEREDEPVRERLAQPEAEDEKIAMPVLEAKSERRKIRYSSIVRVLGSSSQVRKVMDTKLLIS
jgi:hypothetical protein